MLEMQKQDPTLEKYWKMAKGETKAKGSKKEHVQFVVKSIYRKHKEILKDSVRMQLMLPKQLHDRVMFAAPESLMSAYQGIRRTQERISAVFYWLADVKNHVKNYNLCFTGMGRQGLAKASLGHLPLVGEPFRAVCVDIAGPIEPRSTRGFRYILSIADMATRFPEAIPLKTITAEEVTEELFKFYCRMGIPEKIHTDRGS